MPAPEITYPLGRTLRRGLFGRCPKCGEGKLFRSYLKQVDRCAQCHEAYGEIRADDGPAWLTIMISGHVFAFSMPFMGRHDNEPDMLALFLLLGAITLLSLAVLHRAKGMFIAMIWRQELNRAEEA